MKNFLLNNKEIIESLEPIDSFYFLEPEEKRQRHEAFLFKHLITASVLSILVFIAGSAGVFGWLLNIEILKSVAPGLATMKFNTALCFILSGLSLAFFTMSKPYKLLNQPSISAAILTLIVATATLLQYLYKINLGIDEFFIRDYATALQNFPGRMSPATALCFTINAAALILINFKKNHYAQLTSFIALTLEGLSLIGYIYDVSSIYNVFIFSSMALNTTIGFIMLSIGILFSKPEKGLMKSLTSNTAGGLISRRLIPVAVIIPSITGILILEGKKLGNYDLNFSMYLFVLITIAVLCSLIFINAKILYKSDIEREKIIETLISTEKKYRKIFENSMEGLFQVYKSGKLFTMNPTFYKMLGYESRENLIKKTSGFVENLFARQIDYQNLMSKAKKTGYSEEFETRLLCSDGSQLWVLINIHLVKQDNASDFYQGTVMNITKRKIIAKERESLQLQLQQSQKMETVGRLAGGIAHDFNNLLVPIIGYSELGMMDTEDDKTGVYENFSLIKKAADRAAKLVKQILAFSRQQILNMEILNLNEVLEEFKPMLTRLLMENIELKTVLNPEISKVYADKGQMEQVIMNLVINAGDAMPEGGIISIETANIFLDDKYTSKYSGMKQGYHVMIAFSDNGDGIDQETQKKIFDPFYTTKKKGKGTGLGLATVYGIIKQHKGNIWLYSEVGGGTTFKVYLPVSNIPVSQKNEDKKEEFISEYGTETIIVAEDEEIVRKLVCETLEAFGYKVIESYSTSHCMILAQNYKSKIDLLITDVIMPETNGGELYQNIKKIIPNIKVLYMSGYTDNVVFQKNLLKSNTNFLQKPFTVKGLVRKVRTVLEKDK